MRLMSKARRLQALPLLTMASPKFTTVVVVADGEAIPVVIAAVTGAGAEAVPAVNSAAAVAVAAETSGEGVAASVVPPEASHRKVKPHDIPAKWLAYAGKVGHASRFHPRTDSV